MSRTCPLVCSLQTQTSQQKEQPKNFGWNRGEAWKKWFWRTKTLISLISSKIGPRLRSIEDQQEVTYAFSIGAKINDLK